MLSLNKQTKTPGTKHPGNWDIMKRLQLRIIRIEEWEKVNVKSTENGFNKIIEENFPNLKKEENPIKVQKVCRTQNRLGQKRKSP